MRWFDLYVGIPLIVAILGGPPLLALHLLPGDANPWAHSQKPIHYNHNTRHTEVYVDGALSPPPNWPTASIGGDPTVRSLGTAFAIDRFGVWVTAKHTVEGCRAVVLETAKRFLVTAKVVHHRTADLSLIYLGEMTQSVGIPLPDSTFEPAAAGTVAYGFGYGGENGSRTIESISQSPIRVADKDRPDAPLSLGQFWSIERLPSLFARKIGGMSGGRCSALQANYSASLSLETRPKWY